MNYNIFLLAHQDDEIGIFNHIEKTILENKKILIIYLTNGSIKKKIDKNILFSRDIESLKVLKKLGVKNEEIIFLGRKLENYVYKLHINLNNTYEHLLNLLINLPGEIAIYTHSNEGGNIDHDSCFFLTKKLINNISKVKKSYQFSLYNSNNMPLKLFNVLHPLKDNGPILKFKINFKQKIKYSKLIFYYLSQIKIWIGLYPILIIKIFLNNYGSLQEIEKNYEIKKPHKGLLWYEKRKFILFDDFKNIVEKFFKN